MIDTFFSIIIPVYNQPTGITDTLNSLLKLDYPKDRFEIIVVDNGSTDNTFKILTEFKDQYPELINILQEKLIQSSYAARNAGIKNSKGNTLVFIDADMTAETDFLNKVDSLFSEEKIQYAGFNVKITPSAKETIFEKYDKQTAFPIKEYVENRHFAPTCALAVRKTIFENVGEFINNITSGCDYEFGNRCYNRGIIQHFAEDILLFHPSRKTLYSLIKKAYRVGNGRCLLKRSGVILNNTYVTKQSLDIDSPLNEKATFFLIHKILLLAKLAGYLCGLLSRPKFIHNHIRSSRNL